MGSQEMGEERKERKGRKEKGMKNTEGKGRREGGGGNEREMKREVTRSVYKWLERKNESYPLGVVISTLPALLNMFQAHFSVSSTIILRCGEEIT